jgi:hypothetical protein
MFKGMYNIHNIIMLPLTNEFTNYIFYFLFFLVIQFYVLSLVYVT